MSFYGWAIGNSIAKYIGRLVSTKNPLVGMDVITLAVGTRTMLASEILAGLIKQDPQGAVATDTFPTAALLVAELGDAAVVGGTFDLAIMHTGTAAEDITVAAGSGGTVVPATVKVDADEVVNLRVRLDNVTDGDEAYTIYSMGVHVLTSP